MLRKIPPLSEFAMGLVRPRLAFAPVVHKCYTLGKEN
jgi:hypothetical protein